MSLSSLPTGTVEDGREGTVKGADAPPPSPDGRCDRDESEERSREDLRAELRALRAERDRLRRERDDLVARYEHVIEAKEAPDGDGGTPDQDGPLLRLARFLGLR